MLQFSRKADHALRLMVEAASTTDHAVPMSEVAPRQEKLGKSRIEKVGESPFKTFFDEVTFAPRTVV